jgi:hypothetical protein
MPRSQKAKQFGVQYRDMHTAIHNVMIFDSRDVAETLLEMLMAEVPMSEAQEALNAQYGDDAQAKDRIEINFRNPPSEYRDEPLLIINDNGAPDVY